MPPRPLPSPAFPSSASRTLCFVAALGAVVALVFASYTQHAWEDYYITFRTSKNLVDGHGLVFTPGERVHSFTSPLGVLLPALSSWVTGGNSDAAALWGFRLMSIAALSGAAALVFATLKRLTNSRFAPWWGAAFVIFEAKIVDFSTNGMEIGFLLLFVAWSLHALARPGPRQFLHLGAAWAGIMWTRPDGFIYIGLLGAGYWIFNFFARDRQDRADSTWLLVKAAGICTLLYLPWFLWAWSYYGSPIPHTITAKGSLNEGRTVGGFLQAFVTLPLKMWTSQTTVPGVLMPTYFQAASWPASVMWMTKVLGFIAMVAWVWPGLRPPVRAASLAFHGGNAYLTYFPYYPFPWYFPILGLLGALVWGGLLGRLWSANEDARRFWRRGLAGAAVAMAAALVVLQIGLLGCAAVQMEAKQRLVYSGNLRRVGEWLKAQAQPGDRVFLEPLGYIGYFSQLATDDFPGLSCPRMVEARKEANNWSNLLLLLGPDWAVLRPPEIALMNRERPEVLGQMYEPVEQFDVTAAVAEVHVPDRFMLDFDAHFTVYRRRLPMLDDGRIVAVKHLFGDTGALDLVGGMRGRVAHAPSTMAMSVPAEATVVTAHFGFPAGAYAEEPWTDGATFGISWEQDGAVHPLGELMLDPVKRETDRGLHSLRVNLPSDRAEGGRLILSAHPRDHPTKDWTFWGHIAFE